MSEFNPRIDELNNGVANRQRNIVGKKRPTADENKKPSLTIRQKGAGPIVTDISFNRKSGTLQLTRGHVFSNKAVDALRRATLMQGAAVVDSPQDVTAWWPDNTTGDSLILPTSFVHGDALPPLPEGYAYCRLDRGSQTVGMWSWDCDEEDSYWTRTTALPSSAVLMRALFSDLNDPATVELWFDQPIQARSGITASGLFKHLVFFTSRGGTPYPQSIQISGNKATVTLSRGIDLREVVYVQVSRGLLADNATSELVPVTGKGDRYQYVIGINRGRSSGALSVGAPVVLSEVTLVEDSNGNTMPVFDIVPLGGASGGTELLVGVIAGGNGEQSLFLEAAPLYNEDGTALMLGPTVEDWEALDVPEGYQFGVTALPEASNGLGYVQLTRPSEWGGKSWLSGMGLPLEPPNVDTALPPYITGAIATQDATIRVFFSHGVPAITGGVLRSLFGVTSDSTEYEPLQITSAGVSAKVVTLTLDRQIEVDELVTVTVSAGAFKNEETPPSVNEPQSITAILDDVRGSIVFAVSRFWTQAFTQGTLVVMADMGFTITDDNGETHAVLDVLHPLYLDSLPHSHTLYGVGPYGGGPAVSPSYSALFRQTL